MCLQYPNMYAPKEVKDNLEHYGLHVEESQGNLLDNLKHLSDVPIDINEESDDPTILNQVAKQLDKTIEIIHKIMNNLLHISTKKQTTTNHCDYSIAKTIKPIHLL